LNPFRFMFMENSVPFSFREENPGPRLLVFNQAWRLKLRNGNCIRDGNKRCRIQKTGASKAAVLTTAALACW
jgi:hypothetical protein